jgi:hypothetical protein
MNLQFDQIICGKNSTYSLAAIFFFCWPAGRGKYVLALP